MRNRINFTGRLSGLATCALLLVSVAGCRSAGELRLFQPQLEGWQRELKLQTDQAHWASAGDSDIERLLVEFPLPGARTGRATYLLYLRLPAGESKVVFGPGGSAKAGGFMIQTRGEYAGLAQINGGVVQVVENGEAKQEFKIDLTSEDGSQIIGNVKAVRDDYRVSRFENKQRPADVQALLKPKAQAGTRPSR